MSDLQILHLDWPFKPIRRPCLRRENKARQASGPINCKVQRRRNSTPQKTPAPQSPKIPIKTGLPCANYCTSVALKNRVAAPLAPRSLIAHEPELTIVFVP